MYNHIWPKVIQELHKREKKYLKGHLLKPSRGRNVANFEEICLDRMSKNDDLDLIYNLHTKRSRSVFTQQQSSPVLMHIRELSIIREEMIQTN